MRIYPGTTVDYEFKTLGDLGHTGSLNDRQSKFLKAQGYTGALADMMKQHASSGGGTVPAAFTAGQWTLSDSPSVNGDKLTLNITALPSDGGSAITQLQYKVEPGTWTLLSGTGTGSRTITVLAGSLAVVQIRAVNAIGNGTASDTKSATPSQLAGPTNTVAPAMTGTFTVGQTITVSNGTWSVTPDEYERRWTYGSTVLSGETGTTYEIDDFTFGQNLFAEVRCRQTGGAWSNWVTATGGQTVAANAQNVKWVATYTAFDPDNPRTETTPAVSAGDMIALYVKTRRSSLSRAHIQSDFNIGTLRHASGFANGETIALVTYVCPTSETGLNISVGHPDSGAEFEIAAINMGPHIFDQVSGASVEGSSAFNFPTPTAAANAKVLWALADKDGGSVTATASPTPPAKSTSTPYAAGGNWDSGDNLSWLYFIRTQSTAGTVASQSFTPSSFFNGYNFVATFIPQIVAPSDPPGLYRADSNGAGIARTSTISSMVTDGVTINLAAARKVGNYISNNMGLGTLFIEDAGSGVTISSHTGNVLWKNPRAIVDGVDSQPFVNKAGMSGPPYDAGLASASPVSLVAGDVALIAVTQDPAVGQSYVSKYVTVHVVGTIPFDDEFAPPYCWDASLGARPRFRFSDWNQGTKPLPSLTNQSNAPSLATVQQTYNRRTIDLVNTWNNYSISATLHQPLYGTDLMDWERDAIAYLCGTYTLEQKKPMLVGLLQRGIDCWGVYKTGKAQSPTSVWYAADGGHKPARKMPIILAGHLLGVNAMRDVDSTADVRDFSEDGHTAYITQGIIDHTQAGGWNGGAKFPDGSPSEAYVQGMLNGQSLNFPMPEWCGKIYDPTFTPNFFNAHWDGHAYRYTGYLVEEKDWSVHMLFTAAMGLDAYWGGNAYFDYTRRHNEIQRYGVDPWRLAGGGTNRYPMVGGAPGVGDRAPPSDSSGWAMRMYWAHVDSVWPYPWA